MKGMGTYVRGQRHRRGSFRGWKKVGGVSGCGGSRVEFKFLIDRAIPARGSFIFIWFVAYCWLRDFDARISIGFATCWFIYKIWQSPLPAALTSHIIPFLATTWLQRHNFSLSFSLFFFKSFDYFSLENEFFFFLFLSVEGKAGNIITFFF